MLHYYDLVLTVCIKGFDVHMVLKDLGISTYLLQLPALEQMKLSLGMLNSTRWILFCFNSATTTTLGDVALPEDQSSDSAGPILNRRRLGTL